MTITNRATNRTITVAALAFLVALAGCGSSASDPAQPSTPASTYLVEYLPGTMGAVAGKSTFQLRVRTRADYLPATGLAIAVKPVMYMPDSTHAAPADVVTESATTPGTYDGAVFYQMASGANMGYWELIVSIGTEKVIFYPSVGMAMGTDTVKANLWGVSDNDAATPTASTKYVIFKDAPLSAAAGTLKLYVSRAEDSMMTFKPVTLGSVLAGPTGTITSASLTVSTDAAFTAPIAATDDGHGHWSAALPTAGLTAGAQATVYLKLKVNGEDKTKDGLALSASNGSIAFKVTPQ
jgi:hypothetical protein